MVGPTDSLEERDAGRKRLKIGFVATVAASGGLVALQAGATPVQMAVAVVAGALVGGACLWFVLRWLGEMQPDQVRSRRP